VAVTRALPGAQKKSGQLPAEILKFAVSPMLPAPHEDGVDEELSVFDWAASDFPSAGLVVL